MLDTFTQWAVDAVRAGGPLGLTAVMLVENLFPPIPSEAVLPLAGFLVERGELGFGVALAAATMGSVLGALALYALGRWGGRPVLLRYHRVLRLDERQLDRADGWFDRHGAPIVFWCRLVPLARSVVSVPAGASQMPVGRFLLLTTTGSLLWNGLLVGAGAGLGANWERVSQAAEAYSDVALVAFAVLFAVGAVALRRRTARARAEHAGS